MVNFVDTSICRAFVPDLILGYSSKNPFPLQLFINVS